MSRRILPALTLLLTLGGCLEGATYDFATLDPALTVSSGRTVSVSVIDQRPYVVNGEKSPGFAGTASGRTRETVDVGTASGRPLAEELTDAVVHALGRRGTASSALPLPKGAPEDVVLAAFRTQASERLLVVQMYEWQTNANTRVTSHWDMEAIVYDRSGGILARRATRGTRPIGTTDLKGDSSRIAIGELSRKLSDLLNKPAIATALK